MNAAVKAETAQSASIILAADLPALGAPFGGGHYTGRILVPEGRFAIITAGADGELEEGRWSKSLKRVEGARSFYDCLANTRAMAEAGSKIARAALDLRIGGFDDWAIPSRDIAEMQYRKFKPGIDKNWVYRNGENPSSFPVGYPYAADFPTQTEIASFREGGANAFARAGYWTSTQCEGDDDSAWIQLFVAGNQGSGHKDDDCRARAVRRLAIQ